jgi:hypothetical protein
LIEYPSQLRDKWLAGSCFLLVGGFTYKHHIWIPLAGDGFPDGVSLTDVAPLDVFRNLYKRWCFIPGVHLDESSIASLCSVVSWVVVSLSNEAQTVFVQRMR